jgi:hypothetical protein
MAIQGIHNVHGILLPIFLSSYFLYLFCSNTLQDIDDLLNGKKTSSQTSSDVYKKLHVRPSTQD